MDNTDASGRAIATWIGTLASGGIIRSPIQEAGITLACFAIGESEVSGLREWCMAQDRETIERAQRAAIEACCWIATADRTLVPEELAMLEAIIAASDLDDETRALLRAEILDGHDLDSLADRLGHPALRELLIALGWELAEADGNVDERESAMLGEMAERLDVSPERSSELHEALRARLGDAS